MLLCEAWNASMICWVTGWDLPGLLVQNVICEAGLTFDQSTLSADDDAGAPGLLGRRPPAGEGGQVAGHHGPPVCGLEQGKSDGGWPGQSLTAPWVNPETMKRWKAAKTIR